jgi:hypothetical protein
MIGLGDEELIRLVNQEELDASGRADRFGQGDRQGDIDSFPPDGRDRTGNHLTLSGIPAGVGSVRSAFQGLCGGR